MTKLCLIALPSPFANEPAMDIPLGLAYISSYLKQHGFHDITLLDYNLYNLDYYNHNSYLGYIPSADVYGIQCTTPQFYWLVQVAKYIKRNLPNAVVIAGGPHPTNRPEECIEKAGVDICVINEGEETMLKIMQNKLTYEINEIWYRNKDDDIVRTSPGGVINHLDELPFPDRELVDIHAYKRTLLGHRAVHIVTSRGCPYNCSFCDKVSVGRKVRWRSVENVLSEVDDVIEKYSIKCFIPYDDCFTLNKERSIKIAEGFKERGIRWRCWSRADHISYEVLSKFKECGITSITLGIESGDDRMLKVYKKGVTAEQNEAALMLCQEARVPVRCSIMFGGPYETKESVDNTIEVIKKTQPDEWNLATFIPVPGSDIGDHPEKYEIKIFDDPLYMNYHRLGESGMGNSTVKISTLSTKEYEETMQYMLKRLLKECKRNIIQDTIQDFGGDKIC